MKAGASEGRSLDRAVITTEDLFAHGVREVNHPAWRRGISPAHYAGGQADPDEVTSQPAAGSPAASQPP
jgi:hypothetical protein